MATKKPDYITEGDGFADITLHNSATIGGVKVTTVRMREPTVNDQLAGEAKGGSNGEQELAIFANLMDATPADVRALTLRNYKRVQTAYLGFID